MVLVTVSFYCNRVGASNSCPYPDWSWEPAGKLSLEWRVCMGVRVAVFADFNPD